jgi:hypothetical protein
LSVKTQPMTSRAAASAHTYDFMGYAFRVLSEFEVAADLVDELLGPYAAPVGATAPTYCVERNPDRPDRLSLSCDEVRVLDDSRVHPSVVIDFIMGDVSRKAADRQPDFSIPQDHAAQAVLHSMRLHPGGIAIDDRRT